MDNDRSYNQDCFKSVCDKKNKFNYVYGCLLRIQLTDLKSNKNVFIYINGIVV
jgi:hypothetical protein